MDEVKQKISSLINELGTRFVEREDEIIGSLLAVLSGEHVLLLGPPGTAKSMLARDICSSIDGGSYYYYLLTRFTAPEEIFGPLSLAELQNDRYHRRTEGYLPTAHVAFLDEIFKANSSILNSLLTLLNERKFHNGNTVADSPLLSTFGASNELPEENQSLEALYDRFLFRYYVNYVQSEDNFVRLMKKQFGVFKPASKISIENIRQLQQAVSSVEIEDKEMNTIVSIRKKLKDRDQHISDRRWLKILNVVRIASLANGQHRVEKPTLMLLQNLTWDKPEQRIGIREIILDSLISGGVNLEEVKQDIRELRSSVDSAVYSVLNDFKCTYCGKQIPSLNALVKHIQDEADCAERLSEYYGDPKGRNSASINDGVKLKEALIKNLQKENYLPFSGLDETQKKLFNKECENLALELQISKETATEERKDLSNSIEENLWLTARDKKDLLMRFEIGVRIISEVETELDELKKAVNKPPEKSKKKDQSGDVNGVRYSLGNMRY